LTTKTQKIKAIFLFYDTIIDDHEFTINPTIESWTKIKHRFYLLYSSFAQMLANKKSIVLLLLKLSDSTWRISYDEITFLPSESLPTVAFE
jgi:hypothetical protein